jgi:thiol-disulfide isomerase/thioredoxin
MFVITGTTVANRAQDQQSASKTTPEFVAIGQPAPEIELPTIMNFPRANASLRDLKGKLLILDFWATYCPPCVSSMPKMSELQKQFEGKIQMMLIGAEDEPTAKKFFARKPQIQLPNALGVYGTLAQHFGIPGLSTYVWIDGQGVVRAVTDHEQVTADNIQAVLDGKPVTLPSVAGYGPPLKFDLSSPLLIDGNGAGAADLQYHSLITGAFRGAGTVVTRNTQGPYKDRRIFIRNFPIVALYRVAFGDDAPLGPGSQFSPARTLLDVADRTRFEVFDNDHVYCYELIVPVERAGQLRQMMRADLDRFYGTTGQIEKRKVKTLVLTRVGPGSAPLASLEPLDPKEVASGFPEGEGQLRIPNSGFYTLQRLIEHLLKLPVVDETGLSGTVNLGLGYKELFAERVDATFIRDALAKYGLSLQEAEREVDLLVIRDLAARVKR